MTVHASKGLEFKYVFVTGLEDGLFPHERRRHRLASYGARQALARRARRRKKNADFFMWRSRAPKKNYFCLSQISARFSAQQINAPSEFLGDIPGDLLEKEGEKNLLKTIYL